MIVPTTKGGFAPSTEMPSEANLLMALSEMQKQGRFKVAGDVIRSDRLGLTSPIRMEQATGVAGGNRGQQDLEPEDRENPRLEIFPYMPRVPREK